MHRRPSYLVWIEIAGILSVLLLLLGPLAFLATEMMDGGGRGGGISAGGSSGSASPPRAASRSRAPWVQGPRDSGRPLIGDRREPSGGSGASVPFSGEWRQQARPDLSGGAKASSGPSGTPGLQGRSLQGTGDGGSYASPFSGSGSRQAQPSASLGSGGGRHSARGGEQFGWAAEAQHLAGRARALSSQLRALDRESATRSSRETADASGEGETAEAATASSDNPGTPETPTVPIDDHLHWLVIAGVLWGVWRLHRGV